MNRLTRRIFTLADVGLMVLLLTFALPAAPAHAGGVVSVCDEAHLRTALSGGGAVTFSCDGYIILASTITISTNTTIDGTGQNVTISGGNAARVFTVKSGATLSLVGLTIREGKDASSMGGGAILANGGNVSINNCLFADTSAIIGGCVMVYNGALTVKNGTFSGCSASLGGAITGYDAAMTVSDSTFSMNDATSSAIADGSGGAIYAEGGALTVSNSTIHRNSADSNGGGIAGDNATVSVINSTFFNNTAGVAGNSLERSGSGSMTVVNTILYNRLGGANCAGSITDGGHNLSYSDSTCPGTHSNPLLQTLNSNGGLTFTMLLGKGSPAIDAGNDAVCAAAPVNNRDQRGVARPQGAHCDIGAVEQAPYSAADVLKVPGDYDTIQEAIDAAEEGGEIWVAEGDYDENLSITESVSLIGGWDPSFTKREPGDSTIDGGGAGRVISVTTTADGAAVTIDGFTIQDGDATGLSPTALTAVPPIEPEAARADGARTDADPRSPSERVAGLKARAADLAGRGLYPGGPVVYGAMLDRLARLTAQAEAARMRARAVPGPAGAPTATGAGSGGGVFSENAGLQLLNCTIAGNLASQDTLGIGGGVFVNKAPYGGVRIAGSTVSRNVGCAMGDGWGGGIYLFDAPGAVVEDNLIERNTAGSQGDGYGGGLFAYESLGVTIRDNRFAENVGSAGGSLSTGAGGGLGVHSSGDAVVQDNLVEYNTGSSSWDAYRGLGGGIFISESDGVSVADNEIRENLASLRTEGFGGGIQLVYSPGAQVTGNMITGNLAGFFCGRGEGGGIKVGAAPDATVSGNQIRENVACMNGDFAGSLGHFGGGVQAEAFDGGLLVDNLIADNATCFDCGDTTGFGGGVFLSDSEDAQVAGNTITGNAGALLDGRGAGGGLQVRDTAGSRLPRNLIRGNRAGVADGSYGGGLVVDSLDKHSTRAVVDGNLILDNRASEDAAESSAGGCSIAWVFDGLTFTNNVVAGNRAASSAGIELEFLPDGGELVNNTIAGNGGSGLHVSGSVVTLTNNIVVSHTMGLEVDAGATATVSYTLWHGNGANTGGDGVINETHPVTGDPRFVKPAAGDFRLTIVSAARDAGDPAGVPPAPDHDADGVARPQGPAVDIGAYEWQGHWQYLPLAFKSFTPRVGWAIGNDAAGAAAIVHTADGGLTWEAQGNSAVWTGMSGNDISAVDDQTAWAALGSTAGAPSGAILHTTDGGAHWVPQAIPAGLTGGIKGVKGISRTEAWAASLYGTVLHTTDGGATWNVVPHPTTAINDVNRIDALGSADVWIASPNEEHGGNSNMIHTRDNGLTWRQEPLPNVPADHGPMTVNAVSPLVAWTALNRSGNVYRTLDGGANWLLVTTIAAGTNDADDLCAAGPNAAWVVLTPGTGAGMLWRVHVAAGGSVDAREFQPASTAFTYEGITCLDERTVWAVGGNPLHVQGLPLGVIVITHDGGEHWMQGTGPADIEYWKVSFVGARR